MKLRSDSPDAEGCSTVAPVTAMLNAHTGSSMFIAKLPGRSWRA